MPRTHATIVLLLAALVLIGISATRGAPPVASQPLVGSCEAAVVLPAWVGDRHDSPGQSEQPFQLIEIERATEQEEETYDSALATVALADPLLVRINSGNESTRTASRLHLHDPSCRLLPVLRC